MPKAKPGYMQSFLTPAESFYEVTRSKPYLLSPEARASVGLTPETWQLELVPDEPPWQPVFKRTCRKADGTAVSMKDLEEMFRARPVRCIKTMQCLLDQPPSGLCSNGFWEGVSLRDVLARVGRLTKVRRLFYTGYYENPKQRFASSLSLSEVLETPPGHLPVFLAFRLNGRPLPVERGGPVRMLAPDPSAPMKTLARLDVHAPQKYAQGQPIVLQGVAMVGASGLKRVDYWLRPDRGTHGRLDADDAAWTTAEWKTATLVGGPPKGWAEALPEGKFPDNVYFLDSMNQKPAQWPLPYSWVTWTVRLENVLPGAYEFRVRAVDLNDFAQPEPRPNGQSGIADVPCQTFLVG